MKPLEDTDYIFSTLILVQILLEASVVKIKEDKCELDFSLELMEGMNNSLWKSGDEWRIMI